MEKRPEDSAAAPASEASPPEGPTQAFFGPYRLDLRAGALYQEDDEVHLQPAAFELLAHLARHPGQLFSREALQEILWPDVYVGDEALTQMIRRIRRVIEAPEGKPRWVLTVPRRGYRFTEEVEWRHPPEAPTPALPGTTPSAPGTYPSPSASTLPIALDPFFGREDELGALADALDEGSRLVTLLGAGGMGKTRLVSHFAATRLGDAPLVFVDLSGAADLDGMILLMSAALDVPVTDEDGARNVERIGRALGSWRPGGVVILDNFETVTRHAAATVGPWLRLAPGIRVIATSRERLALPGERVLPIHPLERDAARALFQQRARAAGALLSSTPEAGASIDRLIEQLDASPLAIELAAGRSGALSLNQVIDRLDRRFQLLRAREGERPPRHQSLRTVIDDSIQRLSPPQRLALGKMSRIPGPLSLETAEGLLEDLLEAEDLWMPDLLQALTDRSLVRVRPQVGLPPVFVIQENVRVFLQLGAPPPEADWPGQLRKTLLARLTLLLSEPRPSLEVTTLIEASLRVPDPPALWAAQMALVILPWLKERGPRSKCRALLDRALAHREALPPAPLVCLLMEASEMLPRSSAARTDALGEAQRMAERAGLQALSLDGTLHRSAAWVGVGRFRDAANLLPPPDALAPYLHLQPLAEAIYLITAHNLGQLRDASAARGENPYGGWLVHFAAREAAARYGEAPAAHGPDCPHRPTAQLLLRGRAARAEAAAYILSFHGHHDEARALHDEALEIYRSLGWRRAQGMLLCNIAVASMGHTARLTRAEEALGQAMGVFEEIGELTGILKVLDYRAVVYILLGRPADARRDVLQALPFAEAVGEEATKTALLKNLALVGWLEGDLASALGRCDEALALVEAHPIPQWRWELRLYRAGLLAAQGALAEARESLDAVTEEIGDQGTRAYLEVSSVIALHLDCAAGEASAGEIAARAAALIPSLSPFGCSLLRLIPPGRDALGGVRGEGPLQPRLRVMLL